MNNRVAIGILAFLVALSGGLGWYSYTLDQQIKALGDQLAASRSEQAARMEAVGDELNAFRREALAEISNLRGDIGSLSDELGALGEVSGETISRLDTLEGELKGVANEVSQAMINADKVYQGVIEATVSVSDGEKIVGSGFIFDAQGHAVTAQHVVETLTTVYVVLSDGRSAPVTITGVDRYSDIAVLALDEEQLTQPLVLADSSSVQIGEPVVAIGNPFDLTETLTAGIVSQKDRFVEVRYDTQTHWVANLIQFDAAVNFGNSGGPLVNSQGEVVGMVIARVDPEKGDGIYYAISANKVKRVAASLIARGSFDYPWLGVVLANLNPVIVQDKGLETGNGVLVKEVLPGSPAEMGDISIGDILITVDEVPIRDIGQLTSYLGEYKSPDEVVSLTLIRESVELEVSLQLGKRQSQ